MSQLGSTPQAPTPAVAPPPPSKYHPRLWTTLAMIVLILLLASKINWQVVMREIGQMDWRYALAASVFLLLGYLICIIRWRLLLWKKQTLSLSAGSFFLCELINGVIPFRAGTAARWYTAADETDIGPTKATMSIGLERTADGIFQVLCLVLALVIVPGYFFLQTQVLIVLIIGCLTLYFLAQWIKKHADEIQKHGGVIIDKLLSRFIKKQASRERVFAQTKKTVKLFFTRPMIGRLSITSLAIWFCFFCFHFLILLGMQQHFSISKLLIISLVSLAIAPPPVFAQIGVYQAFVAGALVLFNINADFATAYAVILQAVQFMWIIPLGIWGLKKTHLSMAQIKQSAKQLKLQMPV